MAALAQCDRFGLEIGRKLKGRDQMKALAEEVLSLQRDWSPLNTPKMQRRGVLVRHAIRDWLRDRLPELSKAVGAAGHDLDIEGRDGMGPKSEIPWVRIHSVSHSPSAHEGWYCVFLFRASGTGLYLTIGHAATRLSKGDFKPRSPELHELTSWARTVIDPHRSDSSSDGEINLEGRRVLATAYERGTAIATLYPAGAVPVDDQIEEDLLAYLRLLGKLYDAQDLARSPDAAIRAAQHVQTIVEKSGQGFGLSADERKAVEGRAMKVAADYLKGEGYEIADVSKKCSYDFKATKDGKSCIVEVKGTTGSGTEIILTANEVAAHQESHPENFLIVVHSIELDRRTKPPRADGGVLSATTPWRIDQSALVPICFRYRNSSAS